ncbi:MAG: hypothetical protein WCK53_02425 [Methanomicrobiales archaeon]
MEYNSAIVYFFTWRRLLHLFSNGTIHAGCRHCSCPGGIQRESDFVGMFSVRGQARKRMSPDGSPPPGNQQGFIATRLRVAPLFTKKRKRVIPR